MTTSIKDKKTMSVAKHSLADVMLKFGLPRKLHLDNGAEFKSKLMENLSQQLGIRKTFISHHHPQANGKLESTHGFIKDCVRKFSIDGVLEWNQLLPYAAAAFNWCPSEYSQESLHFLYFGCDPYLPHLATFLQPKLRYLGSDKGMICLDKLRQVYMLAALTMKEIHSKQITQRYDDVPNYKIGDLVMIRNSDKMSTWDAKYIPNFRAVYLIGSRQLEVSDLTDRIRKVNASDVHKIVSSDHIISSTLDEQVFGRRDKYINDPRILKEV